MATNEEDDFYDAAEKDWDKANSPHTAASTAVNTAPVTNNTPATTSSHPLLPSTTARPREIKAPTIAKLPPPSPPPHLDIQLMMPNGVPLESAGVLIRHTPSGQLFTLKEVALLISREVELSSSNTTTTTTTTTTTATTRPLRASRSSMSCTEMPCESEAINPKRKANTLTNKTAAVVIAQNASAAAAAAGSAPAVKGSFRPAWVKCQSLQQSGGVVWSMRWSPNGQLLATAGHDKEVKIWRRVESSPLSNTTPSSALSNSVRTVVVEKAPILTLVGHEDDVLDAEWSCTSTKLALCSMDHCVRVWLIKQQEGGNDLSGALIGQLSHPDVVSGVAFDPRDEDRLVTSSLDCYVRVWSISQNKVLFSTSPHDNWVTAVVVALEGKALLYGLFDGSFAMLDMTNGGSYTQVFRAVIDDLKKRKDGHNRITGMTVCPTNQSLVLITAGDCRLRLYELIPAKKSARLIAKFKGPRIEEHYLIRATFSHDGSYIVCPSEDRNVYYWSVPMVPKEVTVAPGTVIHPRSAKHSAKGEMFLATGLVGTAATFVPPLIRQQKQQGTQPTGASSSTTSIPSTSSNKAAAAATGALPPPPPVLARSSSSSSSLSSSVHSLSEITIIVADKLGEISAWRNCNKQ